MRASSAYVTLIEEPNVPKTVQQDSGRFSPFCIRRSAVGSEEVSCCAACHFRTGA